MVQNKAPRRKQRGINFALQSAGFQPAFAPRGGELNPEEINIGETSVISWIEHNKIQKIITLDVVHQ